MIILVSVYYTITAHVYNFKYRISRIRICVRLLHKCVWYSTSYLQFLETTITHQYVLWCCFLLQNTIYARTSFLAANNYMYAQNKQIHVRTKQTHSCPLPYCTQVGGSHSGNQCSDCWTASRTGSRKNYTWQPRAQTNPTWIPMATPPTSTHVFSVHSVSRRSVL